MGLSARSCAFVAAISLLLSACATRPPPTPAEAQASVTCSMLHGPNTPKGSLAGLALGAAAGALLSGGKPQEVIIGAALGAKIGEDVGREIDIHDCEAYYRAMNEMAMLRVGYGIPWANPTTGNSGVFAPTSEIQIQHGRQCRDFTQEVTIDGKTEQASGTTCKMPNGDWELARNP